MLQQATEYPLQAVYKERLQPYLADMPRNVLQGLQRLCQVKRLTLLVPMEEAAEYVPHLNCAVVYLPEDLYTMNYAFVFNVRSPYTGIFCYTCVSQVTEWSQSAAHACHRSLYGHNPLHMRVTGHWMVTIRCICVSQVT
jgi:hypothetical protein